MASASGDRGVPAANKEGMQQRIQQRIAAKEQEYESLLQLKQHADTLLASMKQLETELSTLSQGTETVASVMANWANVFKAINISTINLQKQQEAQDDEAEGVTLQSSDTTKEMPGTLVRIPIGRD
jgi:DASH complex subunit DAD2